MMMDRGRREYEYSRRPLITRAPYYVHIEEFCRKNKIENKKENVNDKYKS